MKKLNIFYIMLFSCLFLCNPTHANLQFLADTEDIGIAGNQAPDPFKNQCKGYNLFSCPKNANCEQCSNGKFKLKSCKAGYVRKDNVCIKN